MIILFGSVIGNVPPPFNGYQDFEGGGPGAFISNIIKFAIVIAGLYAVFNFIMAGYAYMSASGDPKKAAEASAKIWQSILGLVVVVSAFIIGGIISNILFGNPTQIFEINIEGP